MQTESPLQRIPHRFPIHACRFQTHFGDLVLLEPRLEHPDSFAVGWKVALMVFRLVAVARVCKYADRHTVLVDVHSCALGIYYLHGCLLPATSWSLLRRNSFSLSRSSSTARQRRKETAIAG